MPKRLALKLQFLAARHKLTSADLTVECLLARAITAEHECLILGAGHPSYPRQQARQRDFEEAAACVEQMLLAGVHLEDDLLDAA